LPKDDGWRKRRERGRETTKERERERERESTHDSQRSTERRLASRTVSVLGEMPTINEHVVHSGELENLMREGGRSGVVAAARSARDIQRVRRVHMGGHL
jgi:hypothetical protein